MTTPHSEDEEGYNVAESVDGSSDSDDEEQNDSPSGRCLPIEGEDEEGYNVAESVDGSSDSDDEEQNDSPSGRCLPIEGEDEEGYNVAESVDGSSDSDDEEQNDSPSGRCLPIEEVREIQEDFQDAFQSLAEEDRQTIKDLLIELNYHPKDVLTMSKILSKAVNGILNKDKDQFLMAYVASSILEFVGVQIEEGRLLYKQEATPKLKAVACMIDDILKLKVEDRKDIFAPM